MDHSRESDPHARDLKAAAELLRRAADKLHDYCAELNGDLNDSLGSEIEVFLHGLQSDPAPKIDRADQDRHGGPRPTA